jgi:hypothetical protein
MTERSRSVQHVADIVGRAFPRMGAVIVGSIMMAVGLGMMVTIVMFPAGVVIGLPGVAMFIGGFFAPDFRQRGER